MGSFMCFMQLT